AATQLNAITSAIAPQPRNPCALRLSRAASAPVRPSSAARPARVVDESAEIIRYPTCARGCRSAALWGGIRLRPLDARPDVKTAASHPSRVASLGRLRTRGQLGSC